MTNAMNPVLAVLGASALRSLLLAAVAALGLKICGAKTAAMRLFVWRVVLVASLAMPFLGQMLPPLRIPTPRRLQSATDVTANKPIQNRRAIASVHDQSLPDKTSADIPGGLASPPTVRKPDAPARWSSGFQLGWNSIGWNEWVRLIYLGMTFLLLTRYVLGIALSRRLIRCSTRDS